MLRQLDTVLRRLPEAVIVTDEVGGVIWGNDKAIELVGGTVDAWIGRSIFESIHPDCVATVVNALASMAERTLDDEGTLLRIRLLMADGSYREVESRGSWLELDDERVLVNVVRKVHDRYESDVDGGNATRLVALVDHSPSILAIVDDDRRIVSVSNAITRLLGHDVYHVRGERFADLIAEHHRDLLARALDEIDTHLHLTLDLPDLFGGIRHFDAHVTDLRSDPSVGAYVATLTDVSELKIAEHQLRQLANHDSLTGTLNRRAFSGLLDEALAESQDIAVLFLDLDGFKAVNDYHGHLAGDAVLAEFGARLQRLVRGADLVGRLGGDEFAIALIGDAVAGSEAISRRIAAVTRRPIDLGPANQVTVGTSVGVALARPDTDASQLLDQADARMYDHKAAKRDRTAVLTPNLQPPGGDTCTE